jgi:hypothetical protein
LFHDPPASEGEVVALPKRVVVCGRVTAVAFVTEAAIPVTPDKWTGIIVAPVE